MDEDFGFGGEEPDELLANDDGVDDFGAAIVGEVDGFGGDAAGAAAAVAAASAPEIPPVIENVQALFPRALPNTAPVVVNTITQLELGVGVDLRALSCGARNVEFVPRRTASATMRLRDPACVAIVRSTGSVSIVGAPSVGAAKHAGELCARIIRRVLNLNELRVVRFRVRSLMARFDLRTPIRLDTLHRDNPSMCAYEPETFCGCTVKLRGPASNRWSVACAVYVTGKVTMTGARSQDELMFAFHTLLPLLLPHAQRLPGQGA